MPSYYRDPTAPTPNVPRKIGVTALITRGETILVERRVDDLGEWAFIGGTVEDSESLVEALHREVGEETRFEVTSEELLGVFSDPERIVAYSDGTVCRVLSIAFRVTVAGDGDPRLSRESAGMQFIAVAELASLPLWPIHHPIRDAFLADAPAPMIA